MKNIPIICLLFLLISFSYKAQEKSKNEIIYSNKYWKKKLSPLSYQVTREKGTEKAYTGKYWDNHKKGKYYCICCERELFDSKHKFNSGTGWPSFYDISSKKNVKKIKDLTFGMNRIEVVCLNCNAHLGHVFKDGPKPTGLRYCINSCSLLFK